MCVCVYVCVNSFNGLFLEQGRDPNVSIHIRVEAGICIRLRAPCAQPRSECEHSHSDRGHALGSNHENFVFVCAYVCVNICNVSETET